MSATRSRAGRHRSRGRQDAFTSNEQTAYVHSWTRAFANAVTRHGALIRRGGERRPGWTNPARYLLPATDVDALNHRDRAHRPPLRLYPYPDSIRPSRPADADAAISPAEPGAAPGRDSTERPAPTPPSPSDDTRSAFGGRLLAGATLRLGLSLDNSLNHGLGDERVWRVRIPPGATPPGSTPHPAEPDRPGPSSFERQPRRPRLRHVPSRHHQPAPALRLLRHRARHPPRTHPGRHHPPDRSLARPNSPQPGHGSRGCRPRRPVPDPRPRREVHRRLRRRLHRHRRHDHQDASAEEDAQ